MANYTVLSDGVYRSLDGKSSIRWKAGTVISLVQAIRFGFAGAQDQQDAIEAELALLDDVQVGEFPDLLEENAAWVMPDAGTEGQILEILNGVKTWVDPSEAGEFVFFLENETADIPDHKVMDNPAQLEDEAFVSLTGAGVVDGAQVQAWVTDLGLPGATFIPSGAWQFHINAFRAAGNRETRLYNEIFKRSAGGVETLLGTTANSIPLTTVEAFLPSFNIYIPALTLLTTDRIVVKTRIRLIGSGSIPASVTIGYSGSTAARLSVPVQATDITAIKASIVDFEARIAALEAAP